MERRLEATDMVLQKDDEYTMHLHINKEEVLKMWAKSLLVQKGTVEIFRTHNEALVDLALRGYTESKRGKRKR